jgi:DNA-binding PadR family transcriptional regulator
MKPKRNDELTTRIIKNFSDILILKYLKIHPLSSGYEILKHLHETYNIVFSPGTIYHEIYMLERDSIIKSEGDANGRMYSLTAKGEKTLMATIKEGEKIQELIAGIFSEN